MIRVVRIKYFLHFTYEIVVHLYSIARFLKKWELAMRTFEFSNKKIQVRRRQLKDYYTINSHIHKTYIICSYPKSCKYWRKKLIIHSHASSNTSICGSKWVVKMIRTIIYYSLSYNWMFSTISYFSSLRPNFFLHTLPSSLFLSRFTSYSSSPLSILVFIIAFLINKVSSCVKWYPCVFELFNDNIISII